MGLDNPTHIALLLILLLLVFGAKRLPEIGKSLGSGMRGFKDSLTSENSQPALNPPARDADADPAAARATPVAAPLVTPIADRVVAPAEEHGPPPAA
jgi:sec-independent protein translocase protein TatA